MPYIKQEERKQISHHAIQTLINDIKEGTKGDAGRTNYIITTLLLNAFDLKDNPSYDKINKVQGILHCVATEIDRVITGPYEQTKRVENGDIGEWK